MVLVGVIAMAEPYKFMIMNRSINPLMRRLFA